MTAVGSATLCDVVTDSPLTSTFIFSFNGAMSDYDFRPGGSLKLKGGVAEGGIVKKFVDIAPLKRRCSFNSRKKKSKGKSKDKDDELEKQRLRELEAVMREEERKTASPAGSSRASPSVVSSDRKTAAERRFEEVQRKRVRIIFRLHDT